MSNDQDQFLAILNETTSPFTLGRLVSIRLSQNGDPINREDAPELFDTILHGWHPNPYGTYGPYTPQEELRDRLNDRLQGKDPGAPINWKGLPHGRQL